MIRINQQQCIEQLYLFSQPKNYFSESTSAKNSLHLLTRILPFVFEHDRDGFVSDLFFNNVLPGSANLAVEETKKEEKTQASPEQIQQLKETIDQLKDQVEEKLETTTSTTPVEQPKEEVQETKPIEQTETTQDTPKEEVQEPPKEEVKEEKVEETPKEEVKEPPKEVPKEEAKPVVEVKPVETTSGKKKKKKNKKKKGSQATETVTETVSEPATPTTEVQSESSTPSTVEDSAASESTTTEPVVEEQKEETKIEETVVEQAPTEETKVEEPATTTEQAKEGSEQTPLEQTEPATTTEQAQEDKKPMPILKIADVNLTTSLAEVMIQTLMRCLFLPEFTVPLSQFDEEKIEVHSENLDENVLWQIGLGVTKPNQSVRKPSWEQMENRNDVVKCLLTCFSGVLYTEADTCAEFDNKFLTIAVSEKMPNTYNLMYSLLNFIIAYDPRGSLPYSSQLASDYYVQYIETSLHILCVLLQHKPKDQVNVYQTIFANHFRNITDMTLLYNRIVLLLRNVVDANYTYLPSSQKIIEFYEEVLLLLWLILNASPVFRLFICKELNITELLIPLLFIIQLHSKQVSKFPIVQLASFTVLLLSGNREFGVALNQPYKISTPLEVPAFDGSYSDLLILFLNKVMVSDKGIIRGLYDCMLTIIANISPYTKSLTMLSSVKLLNLFEAFASSRFLYSSEKNYQFVGLLLEVFNNIIQYQYEGNVHVIYSVLRRGKLFQDLNQEPDLASIREAIMKKHEQKQATSETKLDLPFLPTEEWVKSWKPKLPLYTITTLINTLSPDIEKICSQEYATEEDVINYLKNTTLVGLLPVPHAIIIRTFQGNPRIDTFIITFVWGCIFIKMSSRVPWVDARAIKLFSIISSK